MLRRTLSKAKNADFSRNSGEIAPAKVHHGPGRRIPSGSYSNPRNALLKTGFQHGIPGLGLARRRELKPGVVSVPLPAARRRKRLNGYLPSSSGQPVQHQTGSQTGKVPLGAGSVFMRCHLASSRVQGDGTDHQAEANQRPCLAPPDRRAQARQRKEEHDFEKFSGPKSISSPATQDLVLRPLKHSRRSKTLAPSFLPLSAVPRMLSPASL